MPQYTPNRDSEVTITEQGTISNELVTINIPSTALATGSYTVPTGKKARLVAIGTYQTSGSYTITYINIRIHDGTRECGLYKQTSSSAELNWQPTVPIILKAGDTVRIGVKCGAHTTTGDMTAIVGIQELDA